MGLGTADRVTLKAQFLLLLRNTHWVGLPVRSWFAGQHLGTHGTDNVCIEYRFLKFDLSRCTIYYRCSSWKRRLKRRSRGMRNCRTRNPLL